MRVVRFALSISLLVPALLATGPSAHGEANEAPGAPAAARSLAGAQFARCVLLDNGTVKCWGGGGVLGDGTSSNRGDGPGEMGDNLATVDLGTGRTATALVGGSTHFCALLDDRTVKCWGSGNSGQLGYEDNSSVGSSPGQMGDNLPAVNLGPGRTATAIAAGAANTCAILDNGTVKCWGNNNFGQLGLGDAANRGDSFGEMGNALPTVDLGTGRTATAIAMGNASTCAILDDRTLKCWGSSSNGRLGDGQIAVNRGDGPGEMGNALPVVDLGTNRTATAISMGGGHVCALLDNATVKCWGFNSTGQLGLGDTAIRGDGPGEMGNALPAVELGTGRTARSITAGDATSCVILDDGNVKCWGRPGTTGTLGDGQTSDNRGDAAGEMGDNLATVALGTGRTATAVNLATNHACAILDNRTVKCWGVNTSGELGLGDTNHRGDGPGEMGNNLPTVSLGTGRTAGPRARVGVTIAPVPGPVVAGDDIDYTLTVTNTGGVPLTGVEVQAPDVPDCETTITSLAAGADQEVECTHTTTEDDVPQMVNQVLVTTDQGASALSGARRTRVNPVVIRPDAQLRLGAAAFIGDGVYNTTGASQTRATTVPNLGTATFTVRIQNDGNVVDDLTVLGQPTTARYTVTYKVGPTNVTSQVVAGTYALDDLAPGATADLTLTVKARAGTPVNNLVTRLVTVTSATDTAVKDAVKASVKRR